MDQGRANSSAAATHAALLTILVCAATAAFPATPARAQTGTEAPIARPGNDIGTGQSLPLSDKASNITAGDTRSDIAPRLPSPDLDENAPPHAFLEAARQALAAGRTGQAQEALERAESRALSRSVRPSRARDPSQSPLVLRIADARRALSANDRLKALKFIDAALRDPDADAR